MSTSPDLMSTTIQMLTALGIVLGGLFVVFYLMRRLLRRDVGRSKAQLIRVLASQYIGIKKNIALVEIPGAILVLGVSNEAISLLTKIEDNAVLETIRKQDASMTPSFSDHLQRLTSKFKPGRPGE